MKKGSMLVLKGVIFFIGIIVLVLCLVALPYGISTDRTGYYWPLLLGMYLPAVPFFIALQQALKLLRFIGKNKVFSEASVGALKNIKLCAMTICGMFSIGMPYIFFVGDRDDAPGVVALGFIIIFASFVISAAAAVFQELLQKAVDIKSENDLTV